MRLHVKNLQLLSKSVPELEEDIPKISDLEESVLDCLRNMRNVLKKVSSHTLISQININNVISIFEDLQLEGRHSYLAPVLVGCTVYTRTVDIVEYFTLLAHWVSLSIQGFGVLNSVK